MAGVSKPLTFLTIPLEIREIVYDLLLTPDLHIFVTPAFKHDEEEDLQRSNGSTTWSFKSGSWAMTPHPLSSQLLRVNQQAHTEAMPCLYSRRVFDVTARDTLKILLHNIGPKNFSYIRQIIIDWDELEQFAWNLKKPEYKIGLSGLRCVQIATWRHRHMFGTSVQWRSVKGRERTLLQAASEIIDQHQHLGILAEEPFRRKSSLLQTHLENAGSHRVKWRFIADEIDLKDGEAVVNIQKDLQSLRATQQEADDVGFSLPINDLI